MDGGWQRMYPASYYTLRSIIAPLQIVPQVVLHSLCINAFMFRKIKKIT